MMTRYVHGYEPHESARLRDQARTLSDLLHAGTSYGAGSRVLEVGCGVGGQTVALCKRSPGAQFTAIDVSARSVAQAAASAVEAGLTNVDFLVADLFDSPFPEQTFDHIFVCFVLEHLYRPQEALSALQRLLRPGGSVTVVEGDHGSVIFHPESAEARAAINCQIELQHRAGGNAMVGRQLRPLMAVAGLLDIAVETRQLYIDSSRPEWIEDFTRRTFIAMIEGVADRAVEAGITTRDAFDTGIRALHETTDNDGVFCYTFFKAIGYVALLEGGYQLATPCTRRRLQSRSRQ